MYKKEKSNEFYDETITVWETKDSIAIKDTISEKDGTLEENHLYDIWFEGNEVRITKTVANTQRRWCEPVNDHELKIVVGILNDYYSTKEE